MLRTVEGVFRGGVVELREAPDGASDGTPVLVTFLRQPPISLADRGIGPEGAAELRARLASFADEWDSPEMDIYDHDDTA